jgi:hypothetical protein
MFFLFCSKIFYFFFFVVFLFCFRVRIFICLQNKNNIKKRRIRMEMEVKVEETSSSYAEKNGFTYEMVSVPVFAQNMLTARESHLDENGQLPEQFKGTAIIIEPRKHAALAFVVHNVASNLPPEWDILVLHGTRNKEFAHESIKQYFATHSSSSSSIGISSSSSSRISNDSISNDRKIYFKQLSVSNLNPRAYSSLFIRNNSFLYHLSRHENLFIFQTDSMILNNSQYNPVSIFDFLHLSYVGPPVGPQILRRLPGRNPRFANAARYFMNGGFSLRKKSLSISATRDPVAKNAGFRHEDWMIASHSYRKGPRGTYPSQREAARFAAMWHLNGNPHPFGIHQSWRNMNPGQKNTLMRAHPEVKTLVALQYTIHNNNNHAPRKRKRNPHRPVSRRRRRLLEIRKRISRLTLLRKKWKKSMSRERLLRRKFHQKK